MKPTILLAYLNKTIGGIKILSSIDKDILSKRQNVLCLCLACQKEFSAIFHNVYKGHYKSCGCLQFAFAEKNPRWKGCGDISQSLYYGIKNGAKKRNLPFEVSIQFLWELYLKQEKKCSLSGEKIFFPKSRKETFYTASLDRIFAELGYTEKNVQWVHRDVNFAKQKMSNDKFLNLIKKVYEYKFK